MKRKLFCNKVLPPATWRKQID